MIKKLRMKLVVAAMLSLILVLVSIFLVVGSVSYHQIVKDADHIVMILADHDGKFPLEKPQKEDWSHRFSPEMPYESRYFSVLLSDNDEVVAVNTGRIAAVDTTKAIEYAKTVMAKKQTKGFLGDYRYTVLDSENNHTMIFLDCGREMSSFRSFLITSVLVSMLGLLAVLLLLVYFSSRIVKPFLENDKKQKQFITDAGHELKTPLTIIDADAAVLEMDIGLDNEWLQDIQMQTKRLSSLTNSLMQLSRLEEQPQMVKITFPLSDLVEETVSSFQTLAKAKEKSLTSNIEKMLSFEGDEKAISQLVSILLDNALKYSDEHGKIHLTLEKQKNTICLSVFNTAKSVSKESITHLFDRFYRADKARNSTNGGYGLGLAIASAIVASHSGKIKASTQDEKSLLLVVTLPI